MNRVAVAVLLLALISCRGTTPTRSEHPGPEGPRWEFSEERASAEWCALNRTGPRYAAVLAPSAMKEDAEFLEGIYEGPVRVSIQENGVERYAWNGFRYSVWDIDRSLLVYPTFRGGLPGGGVAALDLDSGETIWEMALAHPIPNGWSFWLNRMTIEIREDKVYAWSVDGGRFLEIFDRDTGRSQGWHRFPSQ